MIHAGIGRAGSRKTKAGAIEGGLEHTEAGDHPAYNYSINEAMAGPGPRHRVHKEGPRRSAQAHLIE